MDKNTVIGLTLIFMLFMAWQWMLSPTEEQIAEQQRVQDSIARAETIADSLAQIQNIPAPEIEDSATTTTVVESDSVQQLRLSGEYGPFALAAKGEEETSTLENDLLKVVFTNKGGRIKYVELKQHYKVQDGPDNEEVKTNLRLLEDEKNKFEYFLPIANLPSGGISTSDLYFTKTTSDNSISFRADAGNGRFFEQKYTLSPGTYKIGYDLNFKGLNNVISKNANEISLNWLNYLDKYERNTQYERNLSTTYFRPVDDDPDHCSCTSDDTETNDEGRIKWVANTNQFFNSTLIAQESFSSGVMEVQLVDEESEDLKKLDTKLNIPFGHGSDETFGMTMYVGPNEFDRLYAIDSSVEDIIPFGSSIFGTINRWVIRPLFNFLSQFIGSKGIVILFLTIIVKLLLYPLTFRMLYSQSKMGALKPRIEGLKDKFKDDSQKQQMETMKLYREFGVNPLGGCMPMVLQMPIWFALYRFFPAAIEFRQASFLWATDLSSYDIFMRLPFEIPFGFGAHISLFTVLWAITTLLYTYYNTKHMDMSANPAMKYMQYLMPVFFLGFFNSFASGLTCYLLFSNLFNIGQTLITKNYIIDQDKIKEELEAYKKKPKKKGGFQERLETALKEQQKIQAQREAQGKKKKKK
jgi:YidC/Oxa1 family membrane protein insertase